MAESLQPSVQRESEPTYVPVYCLTKLNEQQQTSYIRALTDDAGSELDQVQPRLITWSEDHEGDMKDMYRLWQDDAGNRTIYHFAFFVDKLALADSSLIVAQPDAYTMLYSPEATQWANSNLSAYIASQQALAGTEEGPSDFPKAHEGHLESLASDLLGMRGLTYGIVPASAFISVWANLDIANMDMCELVEYHGRQDVHGEGKVEMVENDEWDRESFMKKLEQTVQESA